MVQVTCEKSGLVFEAATRRTKNHPQIMGWISDAYKDGWYVECQAAIKAGKEQGFSTMEQFAEKLRTVEANCKSAKAAAISAENARKLALQEARERRERLNSFLRSRGYRWVNLTQDLEEGFDIFGADETPEWQLFDAEKKPVSVRQAMQREYAATENKFAKEWLTERNIVLAEVPVPAAETVEEPAAQPVIAEQRAENTMKENVKRGIAYLDENEPGWLDKINLATLDMHSKTSDLLAQITGGANSHHYLEDNMHYDEAIERGFMLHGHTPEHIHVGMPQEEIDAAWKVADELTAQEHAALTTTWKEAISALQAQKEVVHTSTALVFRRDDHVVVEATVLEVESGRIRVAFPNGHHFWIDAEHANPDIFRKTVDGRPAWRAYPLEEVLNETGMAEATYGSVDVIVEFDENDNEYVAKYVRAGNEPHAYRQAPTLEQLLAENPGPQ